MPAAERAERRQAPGAQADGAQGAVAAHEQVAGEEVDDVGDEASEQRRAWSRPWACRNVLDERKASIAANARRLPERGTGARG